MIHMINTSNNPHVYIIRNKHNGMYYWGVHNGKNTSTYTGSSKQLNAEIVVYGEDNFEKEIVYVFNTVEEAYLMEKAIVTWDEVRNPMCYNKQLGGHGGGKSFKGATDYHKSSSEYEDNTQLEQDIQSIDLDYKQIWEKHRETERKESIKEAFFTLLVWVPIVAYLYFIYAMTHRPGITWQNMFVIIFIGLPLLIGIVGGILSVIEDKIMFHRSPRYW